MVVRLRARMDALAAEAVPPYEPWAPWQGMGYGCCDCNEVSAQPLPTTGSVLGEKTTSRWAVFSRRWMAVLADVGEERRWRAVGLAAVGYRRAVPERWEGLRGQEAAAMPHTAVLRPLMVVRNGPR